MPTATVTIRRLSSSDSISALTALLHRAYRPLADAGMRFVASHQDEATTLKRASHGCFVAALDNAIVGTIAYHPPGTSDGCPWYERPDVAYFGQFAVEPKLQHGGVGGMLLARVEMQARTDGAAELAFDTSERAAQLIAYYSKRGFRFIEYVQWDTVNYRSMVMSKRL